MKAQYGSLSLILVSMVLGFSVFASENGGHSGNGGDPNEVATFVGKDGERLESWNAVRKDLIDGFTTEKYLELDLGSVDKNRFKLDVLRALRTAKITWDNKRIVVEGTPRPCENYKDSKGLRRIHCNQTTYASAMKNYDSETEYKMIAHEYFGVAGYEPNTFGISSYPYSDQISKSLSVVVVKRWAVATPISPAPSVPCAEGDFDQPELVARFAPYVNSVRASIEADPNLSRDGVTVSKAGKLILGKASPLMPVEDAGGMSVTGFAEFELSNGVKVSVGSPAGSRLFFLKSHETPATYDGFGRVKVGKHCVVEISPILVLGGPGSIHFWNAETDQYIGPIHPSESVISDVLGTVDVDISK